MAFILAGIIVLGTFGWAALLVFAAGMSDAPSSAPTGAGWSLGIGLPLAALVAATHWLPHIGW